MSMGMCGCSKVAKILLIIGALNWGLIGVGYFFNANWNVVNLVFGNWMWLEAVIYILVGLAGVSKLFGCRCKKCVVAAPMNGGM
jgi:uncharacterized membrane protein YuzA (DUF378 family)